MLQDRHKQVCWQVLDAACLGLQRSMQALVNSLSQLMDKPVQCHHVLPTVMLYYTMLT
jgi:hypothetical protein